MGIKHLKEKGTRAERDWAELLQSIDPAAHRTPLSGAIEGWKSDITTKLPISFEVKHQESWDPIRYYEQARDGLNFGSDKIPVAVMKKNNRPFFVFFKGDDFITILSYAVKGGLGRPGLDEFLQKAREIKGRIHPVPKPQKAQKSGKGKRLDKRQ